MKAMRVKAQLESKSKSSKMIIMPLRIKGIGSCVDIYICIYIKQNHGKRGIGKKYWERVGQNFW